MSEYSESRIGCTYSAEAGSKSSLSSGLPYHGAMARLRLEAAEISQDPYPHLVSFPALPEEDYRRFKEAVPGVEAFDVKGNGTKLELDIIESGPAFVALPQERREALLELRQLLRNTAPNLAGTFAPALRAKYEWLLGPELARETLAAGWTTTNGRVMGRAPGYKLDPHLDSAQQGMTCLLYLTDAPTPEEGALGLYRPEKPLEVRAASTYYPKAEGVGAVLVKSIPVRENKFVSFVSGPSALHGFGRDSEKAQGWRFVYQCHVVPAGMKMDILMPKLPDEQRRRWEKYLRSTA